jgi:hypothetical protein
MTDNGESFPSVFEGKALEALIADPFKRSTISRITVTSDTTMVIEMGAELTVAVASRPPLADGRPWTITVERTLLRTGSTMIVAQDMPVDGIGLTKPSLPHLAVITTAIGATAAAEAGELGRDQLVREFFAVLSWICPGAMPGGSAAVALMDGRGAARWERRGRDVILTLEINAGPMGPTGAELFG